MKKAFRVFSSVLIACLFVSASFSQDRHDQTHADLVLLNGAICTMNATRDWAQAIAVTNGKIDYIGSNKGVASRTGFLTKVIDLEGKMVLPGFYDSHVHPIASYLEEKQCDLTKSHNREDLFKTIRDYAAEHKQDKWIIGSGWALPFFPQACPSRQELDNLVPEHPAFFRSADGHSAWVNSKALELAGINQSTVDPPCGTIERDAKTREPIGTLRESAVQLVKKLLPESSNEEYRQAALAVQKNLNAFGIIGVQEAHAKENILKAYSTLDEAGLLTVYVNAALHTDGLKGPEQIEDLKILRSKYSGDLLRVSSAKIFADGVIEAKTAALLEPYVGAEKKDNMGMLERSPESFKQFVEALDKEKFQVHVHAIGDRAVRVALDSFAAAKEHNQGNDLRHHIAHLELIHPADVPRFRQLNVTANFQPFWAYRDKYIADLTEPVLGPERSQRIYPFASVYRSGARIAAGSDWSVSSLNPLDAIQVAITRCGLEQAADNAFLPEQKLELPEILAAYTINGAYLCHTDKISGSLEVGKSADIIVLDKNIFSVPEQQIHDIKVLMTVFRGRIVYRDPLL